MNEIRLYDAQDIHYASLNAEEVYQEETRGDHPGIWRWTKSSFSIRFSSPVSGFYMTFISNSKCGFVDISLDNASHVRKRVHWGINTITVDIGKPFEIVHISTWPLIPVKNDNRELGICIQEIGKLLPRFPNSKKLLFMHIPKCAGISIDNYFKKIFGAQRCLTTENLYSDTWNREISDDEFLPYSYIGGHFTISLPIRLKLLSNTFTVLRDPVDRVISQYYFLRNGVGRHRAWEICNSFSLQELMRPQNRALAASVGISNSMVGYLNGGGSGWTLSSTPVGDEFVIEIAKCAMNSMLTVGFLDNIQKTISSLLAFENIQDAIPFDVKDNVGSYNREVGNDTEELIRQANHLDCAIYDWAVEKFGSN